MFSSHLNYQCSCLERCSIEGFHFILPYKISSASHFLSQYGIHDKAVDILNCAAYIFQVYSHLA
jgi:hypothetical protein